MERKSFRPNGQSYSLHRTIPTQRENRRKMTPFGRSTVPRLPPIVQEDYDVQVSPKFTKTVISKNFSARDDVNSATKRQSRSTDPLPRLERTPFYTATHFTRLKNPQQPASTNCGKDYERPQIRTQTQLDFMREKVTKKQEISGISDGFMRGRRKKKDRLSSYKCTSSTEVIDDEISGFERRVGFDSLSGTTPTQDFVKDMRGRMVRSSDVYGEGVSSLINILDHDEDEKSKKALKPDSESESSKVSRKNNPVRERFLKALDAHFYNEFLTAKSGRRMAICEELEKLISGDGKTSLNSLREHLRLQDVLDSWVL